MAIIYGILGTLFYISLIIGIFAPVFRLIGYLAQKHKSGERDARSLKTVRVYLDIGTMVALPLTGIASLRGTVIWEMLPWLLVVALVVIAYFIASYRYTLLPLTAELALNGLLCAGILINSMMGLGWGGEGFLFIGCAPIIFCLLLALARRNNMLAQVREGEQGMRTFGVEDIIDYIGPEADEFSLPIINSSDQAVLPLFMEHFGVRALVYTATGAATILLSSLLAVVVAVSPLEVMDFYYSGADLLR